VPVQLLDPRSAKAACRRHAQKSAANGVKNRWRITGPAAAVAVAGKKGKAFVAQEWKRADGGAQVHLSRLARDLP